MFTEENNTVVATADGKNTMCHVFVYIIIGRAILCVCFIQSRSPEKVIIAYLMLVILFTL